MFTKKTIVWPIFILSALSVCSVADVARANDSFNSDFVRENVMPQDEDVPLDFCEDGILSLSVTMDTAAVDLRDIPREEEGVKPDLAATFIAIAKLIVTKSRTNKKIISPTRGKWETCWSFSPRKRSIDRCKLIAA